MTNISNRESISGARSAKNRWVPAWRLLGLLRALFASGCGRGERTELRLAINPWPGSEFLDLAKEKGFLAQEGLNVRRQHLLGELRKLESIA